MTMRAVAIHITHARMAMLDSIHANEHVPPPIAMMVEHVATSVASRETMRALQHLAALKGRGRVWQWLVGERLLFKRVVKGVENRIARVGRCPGVHAYAEEGIDEIAHFLKKEGSE